MDNYPYDDLERRCPRLGNSVAFAYCRTCGDNGCCFKILDCWWERFDVAGYLKARLSEADFSALAAAEPKPKVTSLIELIRRARERSGQAD